MSKHSQVEASREDRYYEIWSDLVINGMPTHEADIKAEHLLEQEEEERN
tara:strand:- start:564 stop:710 length:147 start_codon:yes stop_codon:yes gene_type:complete